jgi:hypothetical protein
LQLRLVCSYFSSVCLLPAKWLASLLRRAGSRRMSPSCRRRRQNSFAWPVWTSWPRAGPSLSTVTAFKPVSGRGGRSPLGKRHTLGRCHLQPRERCRLRRARWQSAGRRRKPATAGADDQNCRHARQCSDLPLIVICHVRSRQPHRKAAASQEHELNNSERRRVSTQNL